MPERIAEIHARLRHTKGQTFIFIERGSWGGIMIKMSEALELADRIVDIHESHTQEKHD